MAANTKWVCLAYAQLKVYDGELVERMRDLLSSGLCITLNSDDPSYFGEAPFSTNISTVAGRSTLSKNCYNAACHDTHAICAAGGYIGANYAYIGNSLDLGHEELYQLACNGFEASFLDPEQQATYQQELAAAYKAATGSDAPARKS